MKQFIKVVALSLALLLVLGALPVGYAEIDNLTDGSDAVDATEEETNPTDESEEITDPTEETTDPAEETTDPETDVTEEESIEKSIQVQLIVLGAPLEDQEIGYGTDGYITSRRITDNNGEIFLKDVRNGTYTFRYGDESVTVEVKDESKAVQRVVLNVKTVDIPVQILPRDAKITSPVTVKSEFGIETIKLNENNEGKYTVTKYGDYEFSFMDKTIKTIVRRWGEIYREPTFNVANVKINTSIGNKPTAMNFDIVKLNSVGGVVEGNDGYIVRNAKSTDGTYSFISDYVGKARVIVNASSIPYNTLRFFKGEFDIDIKEGGVTPYPLNINLPLFQFVTVNPDGTYVTDNFVSVDQERAGTYSVFADNKGLITFVGEPNQRYVVKKATLGFEELYSVDAKGMVDIEIPVIMNPEALEKPVLEESIRISGRTRYLTALKIARELAERSELSDTIILATGENFADALVGNSLAGLYNAPILLTEKAKLHSSVKTYLEEQENVKNVIIMGSTGAISEEVEKELKDAGYTTDRIGGKSRFETSTLVYERVAKENPEAAKNVFFANGYVFADALVAGPKAAMNSTPILLVEQNNVPTEVTALLIKYTVPNRTAVGGTVAISNEVLNTVKATRLSGATRHVTSIEMAKTFEEIEAVIVARDDFYADALVAGKLGAELNAPILLNPSKTINPMIKGFIDGLELDGIAVVGGTNAISQEVMDELSK